MLEQAIENLTVEIQRLRDAIKHQNDLLHPQQHVPTLNGMPQVPALPVMLDERAEILAVSVATLRRWRLLRQGPPFRKVGSLVRYSHEELMSWLHNLPPGGPA